jgi:hypothetical protein
MIADMGTSTVRSRKAARKQVEKAVRRLGLIDKTIPFEDEVASRLRARRKKAKQK